MRFTSARPRHESGSGARLRRAAVILASAAALVTAGATAASAAPVTPGAQPAVSQAATTSASHIKQACATPSTPKTAHCMALINTAIAPVSAATMAAKPAAAPSGYGPSQLQSAYNLASAAASKGSGETVYLVDVYDYPTAQSDLNTYRSQFGLPACGTGCFTKLNENGATSPLPRAARLSGWDVEEALDIEMVSAICPLCHITLVEANSASNSDLYTAENAAVATGAKFVSNSWGEGEYSGEATDANTYFNHPGVAIEVSAGDSPGPEFPAEASDVTAVGGTTLTSGGGTRGWTETPWSSSGGGCSAYDAKPSWETSVTGCSKREDNDVSAVADPNTGVAVYDSYFTSPGWEVVGGTSASSPIIAATYALAGIPGSSTYPASDIWAHEPTGLYPVGSGYSSVPGWGTPDGTSAFTG